MKYLPTLIFLLLVSTSIGWKVKNNKNSECRFAKNYKGQDLLNNSSKLDDFFNEFIHWQSKFIKEVGVDPNTGFTFDGIRVDVNTGQLLHNTLHKFTASSKQCIHLAVMAKVLEGAQYADQIYTPAQVFRLIEKKVEALEKFQHQYPGFAGYLPWVTLNQSGLTPAHDFQSKVPALDNGEMFWGALALSRAWSKNYPNILPSLRSRFDDIFWQKMIKNMRKVFFNETTGKIRAVAQIKDVHSDVENNSYTNNDNYYLDDPYQGQLFAWIITLFGKDQFQQAEIDQIWINKRHKLQPAEYIVKSMGGEKITVEKGWWFSSHQQWKLLFLPYRLSPTFKRIMTNNERARTWHSADNFIPGMYGCQAGPANTNTQDTGYFCSGISSIAFQNVTFDKLVTPYGNFPLMLLNRQMGAVWLHNSISSPCGQTLFGALEGTGLNGSLMSPVLTWDTKITTVLAAMNGTISLITEELKQRNLLDDFVKRVENQYKLAFKNIEGELIHLAVPTKQVSSGRPDFTTCK